MIMANPLLQENVWLHQQKFEDAERLYRQLQAGTSSAGVVADDGVMKRLAAAERRLDSLEKENKELRQIVAKFNQVSVSTPSQAKPKPASDDDDDDDDCDMFGDDDEEDAEAEEVRKQRLKEYAAKKSKKPTIIAKSSIVFDVKPWDDETSMADIEKNVRSIVKDGLVWGASKLAEVGYGIKKLVIICVVEDDKVSIEELAEKITTDYEDLVQSVDIAAFNKI